jgi:hypothetical protein
VYRLIRLISYKREKGDRFMSENPMLTAPALPLARIHRSAWKGNSANFAVTEF